MLVKTLKVGSYVLTDDRPSGEVGQIADINDDEYLVVWLRTGERYGYDAHGLQPLTRDEAAKLLKK